MHEPRLMGTAGDVNSTFHIFELSGWAQPGAVIISIDHPVYFPRSAANPISADTACDQSVINSTHFPF